MTMTNSKGGPLNGNVADGQLMSEEPENAVAVVGLACRVAGSDDPEQLWTSLVNKRDASGALPGERWDVHRRRDARNPEVLSRTTSRGYFLDNLADFDAQFFGISPREAEQMDPQQRISLEVAWEALEHAGIPPQSLSGSDTAVFWGVNSDDYSKILLEDLPNIEAWMGIGTAYCGVPNRISYHLDLKGPSSTVDAACASSLVAIHQGRQAILMGECTIAIVGGVNAICGPGLTRALDMAGTLSPDGRCRSFDENADGYGRGEGVGAVVLKKLSAAIRDGDHVLALLKGTAVCQDGKTNGIMAPNGKSQELVARKALQAAKVHPHSVHYVEAHATATQLGDPTEVAAIASVYSAGRDPKDTCYIGSVKPNIGHLEAGAGVMGFIKAVLAVQKGLIPPQANLSQPNSKIDWTNIGVKVVQELSSWPSANHPRRAGVCSYGYGGTVSHAVIEEFVAEERTKRNGQSLCGVGPKPFTLLLSGPHQNALTSEAKALLEWLNREGAKHPFEEIIHTLAVRRGHHNYRAAIIVDDLKDAMEKLYEFTQQTLTNFIAHSRILEVPTGKEVVWVFSGHGAQWADMGKELIHVPSFMATASPLDKLIQGEVGYSPLELLRNSNIRSSDQVQVLTYLIQVGLSETLLHWGHQPQAVIGHSVGEIAASVVAGAITPEEGAIIVARRAKLYQNLEGNGAMILTKLSYAEAQVELRDWAKKCVAVSVDSSPSTCVVSGPEKDIEELEHSFRTKGIKVFRVNTNIAFHSQMMDELASPLMQGLAGILHPKEPKVPLYSTALQDPRGLDLRGPGYWVNNMTNPVLFRPAVNAALDDGYRVFLEVSSHPLVSHSITEIIQHRNIGEFVVLPTMVRDMPVQKTLASRIGQLHCKGVHIDWKKQHPCSDWVQGLPTTRWDHRYFWRQVTTPMVDAGVAVGHVVTKHTLLGHRLPVPGLDSVIFSTTLNRNSKPFPGDHPVEGVEIVPAAVLMNTFIHGAGASRLKSMRLHSPIVTDFSRQIQVTFQGREGKIVGHPLDLEEKGIEMGLTSASYTTHTTTTFESENLSQPEQPIVDVELIKNDIAQRLDEDFSVTYLSNVGVSAMGFPWKVTEHYGTPKEMLAHVIVAPDIPLSQNLPWDIDSWAPILDAATSIGSTLFFDEPRLRMPSQVECVDILTRQAPPRTAWLHVIRAAEVVYECNVAILDDGGRTVAEITRMRFAEITGTPHCTAGVRGLVHELTWVPAALANQPLAIANIIFLHTPGDECRSQIIPHIPDGISYDQVSSVAELAGKVLAKNKLEMTGTAILYVPENIEKSDDIPNAVEDSAMLLLDLIKFAVACESMAKVFVLTNGVADAETPSNIAQGALFGLSRILASEHPDHFGGLFDVAPGNFQFLWPSLKCASAADVVRIEDGVARTACLQALSHEKALHPDQPWNNLLPRANGTYLITGGLGALGLSVADFLVENGARRLILISRRTLPCRTTWENMVDTQPCKQEIAAILSLEARGASVFIISLDIGLPDAGSRLSSAIRELRLPPVTGVIHAAGVLQNELAMVVTRAAFYKVLHPKVRGALTLHHLFPPKSLDFFILFSSCGQLVGFPGQSSYACANSFLDALATHRRGMGDNARSFQWTSWRGMGMSISTKVIDAELRARGITGISAEEAFEAWKYAARFDIAHVAVLRKLSVDKNGIVEGNGGWQGQSGGEKRGETSNAPSTFTVTSRGHLEEVIRTSVAEVLLANPNDIDSKASLSNLGIDSLMMVDLRTSLQDSLKVRVPPTLIWTHPTISHLVGWFAERLDSIVDDDE